MGNVLIKFSEAFKEHKIFYMLVLLFFCIGVVIGVYTVVYMNEVDRNDVTSYFSTFVSSVCEKKISYGNLLLSVLKKSLLLIIPIVLISFTFLGSPIILIIDLIKGFLIGYTFAFIFNSFEGKGLLMAVVSIIPQNLFYIPCIIILSVLGLNVSLGIVKNKIQKNQNNYRLEFIREKGSVYFFTLCFLIMGILFETYISPSIIRLVVTKFYI